VPDHVVARLDALPQRRGRVVHAGTQEVAVFRVGDTVYALDNVCLHTGGPLGEGIVEDGCAVCPLHGWRYRLDDGAIPTNPAVRLVTFPVRVEDGDVILTIAPE
jgi:NAD(P)H-dependent nitrite reductase small subunit